MAAIKMAYVGGGSSRAAGTMASLIARGPEFDGSEIVLIDTDDEHLELVRTLGSKMARAVGVDMRITATTDQRAGLTDADAVLTSFRPGGFAARVLDERIPLKHGVIGQETQGAGGFMMALRSVHAFGSILDDLDHVAPAAVVFNYTNPVNIVSQAITRHSDRTIVSFCEGPLEFPRTLATAAGLDPELIEATMVGINHNCWSVEASYDGSDLWPHLDEAWSWVRDEPVGDLRARRTLQIAVAMRSVPADYFPFYFFSDAILREQQQAPRTRAEFLSGELPDYWRHYREQANQSHPQLDPHRSRGGIHELELALDAMSAYYNDQGRRLPLNLPNRGSPLPCFDEDVVVEVWGTVDRTGFHPEPSPPLPHGVRGITQQLAEFQYVAAECAWRGTRQDAIRALALHPLVPSLPVAESLYDELAHAQRDLLPTRLQT